MKRTEQKRLAILKAAKQEFLEQGFAAANMNNVCVQAGVSKRTLYRHFASKEWLFEQVLFDIQHSDIGQQGYEFVAEQPIETQLYQITQQETHILYQFYGIALSRTLVMEFFRQPELAKTVSMQLSRRRVLKAWFEQALQAGKLKAQSSDVISSIYLNVFQGMFFWPQVLDLALEPNEEELAEKAQLLVNTVVRTFAP